MVNPSFGGYACPMIQPPSLLDSPRAGANAPEFSVGELSKLVKKEGIVYFVLRIFCKDAKDLTTRQIFLTDRKGV